MTTEEIAELKGEIKGLRDFIRISGDHQSKTLELAKKELKELESILESKTS